MIAVYTNDYRASIFIPLKKYFPDIAQPKEHVIIAYRFFMGFRRVLKAEKSSIGPTREVSGLPEERERLGK